MKLATIQAFLDYALYNYNFKFTMTLKSKIEDKIDFLLFGRLFSYCNFIKILYIIDILLILFINMQQY